MAFGTTIALMGIGLLGVLGLGFVITKANKEGKEAGLNNRKMKGKIN